MGENQRIEQILEKLARLEKLVSLLIMQQTEEMPSSTKQVVANSDHGKNVEVMSKNIKLEGIHGKELSCMGIPHSEWILDSGASKHVTGAQNEFLTYKKYPSTHKETIQTADGTCQPIKGIGTVNCTSSINLTSVLHVPSFPVNLLSLSALVDQIVCRVTLDREHCTIQDRRTGKEIGIGVRHGGLWYLDRKEDGRLIDAALVAGMNEDEARVMLQHCRLGHLSFDTMAKVFPEMISKADKRKLVCDACEYGKHTRATYISRGLRSLSPFMLIHSDGTPS